MATSATSDKITINFGWRGPSSWHGEPSRLEVGVVDLIFKNAKTEISVHIPQNISPTTMQKLPFTCRRYQELEFYGHKTKALAKETYPEVLQVTIEQIHNLTLNAGIFEKSPRRGPAVMGNSNEIAPERRTDREIELVVPEELKIGQLYNLVVTSDDLSLSAHLQEEKSAKTTVDADKLARKENLLNGMRKMGQALQEEGRQNLSLAARNGDGVFDSSSTTADVYAHGMQGFFRAGQQAHSDISVPYSKPLENAADLDKLSIEELQSRFEEAFKKDKQYETQRLRAAIAGNVDEMNRISEAEFANSQLLINLSEALERKGIKAQIPESESFQTTANQASEAQAEALKKIEDTCKMQ